MLQRHSILRLLELILIIITMRPPFPERLIDKLKVALPGVEVLTPSSPSYADYNIRWSKLWELPAGAVILPTNAAEISMVVDFARHHSIDLALLGGGHGQRGSSSTNGGLLISLCKMRQISVDIRRQTITVAGGATWGDIHREAETCGLALVGGTCDGVGVGGLTLGGGYGWLTGRHGLALDNLLSAKVVLADGKVVVSSNTENLDLFWAIRGAGPAYGITYSFTFRAHLQPSLCWSGNLTYAPGIAALPAMIKIMNNVLCASTGDSAFSMLWRVEKGQQEASLTAVVFHNGPELAGREFFAPLLNADPISDSTCMRSFSECGGDTPNSLGLRQVVKGASFLAPISLQFMQRVWQKYTEFLKLTGFTSSYIQFEIHNPRAINEWAQTDTAFPNRGSFGNVTIKPTWSDTNDDALCMIFAGEMSDMFRAEFESVRECNGHLDDNTRTATGEYPNDDGINYSDLVHALPLIPARSRRISTASLWRELRETPKSQEDVRSDEHLRQVFRLHMIPTARLSGILHIACVLRDGHSSHPALFFNHSIQDREEQHRFRSSPFILNQTTTGRLLGRASTVKLVAPIQKGTHHLQSLTKLILVRHIL